MRRVLLVVVAALISCSNPPSEGTLSVTVDVSDASLTSRCTKLFARGSVELVTDPLDITDKDKVVVAIYQGSERGEIELQAIGYSDAACTVETQPAERTDTQNHGFGMPMQVTLVMKRSSTADAGVDTDGDGFSPPADCNDDNPLINPGATERCDDGIDNNCNELTDCRDTASCDNQVCGSGALCANARCTETVCNDNVDNNAAGGTDCFDADCDGRACMNAGTCLDAGCRAATEFGLCGDGIDNDGDGATDCADTVDCPSGAACDDQNGCTTSGTCDGVSTCVTTPISCDAPPQCFSGSGVCDVDAGGCPFTPVPGANCNDSKACTTNDLCNADGGCGGSPVVCNAPPSSCFMSLGTCSEGLDAGCTYAPVAANQSSCNDGNECTENDTCDGMGGCLGTPPLASACPVVECKTRDAAACSMNDRCGYVALPNGTPCSSGVCSGGACTAVPVFNYPPSNFVPADLPSSLGAVNIDCATVTINTGLADGGISYTECDGGVRAVPHSIVTNGNFPALLLYMDSLTVGTNGRLRARGSRPLILAVKNDATLAGNLNANGFEGDTFNRGAGADLNCADGEGRPGGIGGSPSTAGGGGGGAFGGNGGRGHFGAGGGNSLGGDGGAAFGSTTLIPLVGGCNGGNGGAGNAANQGRGGPGGGALQISAGGIIHVAGNVTANGSGGEGGKSDARTGGGGGGSGGAILLEAQRVTSGEFGNLIANGGGGGEGSGFSTSTTDYDGERGRNGEVSRTGAAGGTSSACGGAGGVGAALNTTVGNGAAPTNGGCPANMPGGGGGGAMGRIRVNAYDGGCAFDSDSWFSPARSGFGSGCQ